MTAAPGIRIGLALGGGGARGLVHVGVLSVLEREHIPIHCIAGTSAGSIVGAMYCAGFGVAEIERLATQMRWRHIISLVWPKWGFVSFEKMERWLAQLLGDVDISELARPFAAVATDIDSGLSAVLRNGPVSRAVRASCSVPGIVTPVEWDGHLLCDGGISNNLPVSVARDLGADYVIGVDPFVLSPMRRKLGPFGVGLAAIEIMVEHAGGGLESADCLISPKLSGLSYFQFACKELIEIGARAMEDRLPMVREALDREVGAPENEAGVETGPEAHAAPAGLGNHRISE